MNQCVQKLQDFGTAAVLFSTRVYQPVVEACSEGQRLYFVFTHLSQ